MEGAKKRVAQPGFPGVYQKQVDEEDPLLGGGGGDDGGRGMQKSGRTTCGNCSVGWIVGFVVVALFAGTALVLASVALRNTDQGLIGRISHLVAGTASIEGGLVVGGGIVGKKRMAMEAVSVNKDKTLLSVREGRARSTPGGGERVQETSRGQTRAACKSEKLKVLGSVSACGDLSIEGTASLNDTVINGVLTTTGQLTLGNRTRRVIYVGASREYKNVSHALRQFNGLHAGDVHIHIDPGTYVDNIEVGGNFSSSSGLESGLGSTIVSTGMSIFGDSRDHVGISYIDSAPLAYPGSIIDYQVILSTGQVYDAVGSAFDSDGQVLSVGVVTVNDGVPVNVNGCETPFVNAAAVSGKAVLIQRGACGFLLKAQNAAANGAAVTILYQNSPSPPIAAGGGPANTLPGLTVMISAADALLIQALLVTSPSLTMSVVPKPPVTFGSSGGIVDIIHPGGNLSMVQINVAGTNPNFTSATLSVVPGDQLTIVASSDGSSAIQPIAMTRTVASVSGNNIVLTVPLTIAADVPYSSVTFLPNVIIMSLNPKKATIAVINAGLYMDGIAMVSNPAFAFAEQERGLLLIGSTVYCARMVVDVSLRSCNNPVLLVKSALFTDPYAPKSYDFFTVIWGSIALEELSAFSSSYTYSIGSQTFAIASVTASRADVISLQISNGNRLNSPADPILAVTIGSSTTVETLWIANTGSNAPYVGARDISRIGIGSATLTSPKFTTNVAVTVIEHSQITFDSLIIDSIANGIVVTDSSRVVVTGALALTNITFNNYIVHDKAVLSAYQSSVTPLDVITHVSATPVIDHAFSTQIIDGDGSALSAYMDVVTNFATRSLYQGKRFTILNLDGSAHTIKLAPGQRFEAPGVPANANTFTFAAVPNTQIQLFVRSASSVVVEQNTAGGTFSLTAPTKKSIIAKSAQSEQHAEQMYMQYLHSAGSDQLHSAVA